MNRPGVFSNLRQILPSVQNFIDALKEDLANRRSILVVLPSTVHAEEIWPLLRAYIAKKEFSFDEVDSANLIREQSLLEGMCSSLTIKWKSGIKPESINHFYRHAARFPDVVYFERFDELPPQGRDKILKFFTEWSDASHICTDQGGDPMALCMVTSSAEVMNNTPTTDTHRGVHWWWGVPSALEIRLLCRILNSNRDNQFSLWIESILPAIVGADMALADYLWDDSDPSIVGIWQKLRSYSELRQWNAESLLNMGIDEYEDSLIFRREKSSLFRSNQIKQLWGKGVLYWTPEYGVQLNTAVLALLGKKKEVQHRIWRGQVEYLLPMLDQIRLASCEKLTSLYGPAWPYKWHRPNNEEDFEAVKKDPLACELGYLFYLLRTCEKMKKSKDLLPLVNLARDVRNELAHYRPVEYTQYEKLIKEMSIMTES